MRIVKAASDVYVGGAPSEQDLRQLAADGVHTVVDFREPRERRGPKDGPAAAHEAGLAYVNIPVRAPTLSDAHVEELRRAVAGKPAGYLFHCAKGPRAEAMYVLKAALDHRWGPPEAEKEASRLGFRFGDHDRLRGFVRDFTARHAGAEA